MFTTTLVILSFLSVNIAQGETAKIQYMIEQNPPYNFQNNGSIQGIAVDLLIELSKNTSQVVTVEDIELLPWPRAYKTVQHTPETCLFSMGWTEERSSTFKWVGPIFELSIGLIADKKKNITVSSIDDLKTLRVGTIRDGAPEQLLIQAGMPAKTLERVTKPEQNIKKLAIDRLDLLAFNTDSTRYTMLQLGMDANDYETVFILKTIKLYYAFNHNTDDNIITEMNQALDQLKIRDSQGNSPYDDIVSSYLGNSSPHPEL
jgi:polar amino acid transport system substrate-binding protein